MNLFGRKMHVFIISNFLVSFIVVGFSDVNYYFSHSRNTAIVEEEMIVEEVGDEVEEKKEETPVNVVTQREVNSYIYYTPAVYSEVTGNAIVEYAKRYLGLPYVSGGYSLSTGTDCSGFTKLIYQEFGINLSRSVIYQAYNGAYVQRSDLQKGDLVFYGNGDGVVSHVGIYIGDGLVLHESNPRDGVKITTVNMMQYITARRVINSDTIRLVEEQMKEKAALEEEKQDEETELEEVNTEEELVLQGEIEEIIPEVQEKELEDVDEEKQEKEETTKVSDTNLDDNSQDNQISDNVLKNIS